MQDILDALGRAFKSLFHPKMLVLVLWPMLLALLFWGGVFWWFWDSWSTALLHLSNSYGVEDKLAQWGFVWVAHWIVTLILFSLLLPAIYVTSLLFTAIFAMPLMLNFVAQHLISYLVRGPLQEPTRIYPQTPTLVESGQELKTKFPEALTKLQRWIDSTQQRRRLLEQA